MWIFRSLALLHEAEEHPLTKQRNPWKLVLCVFISPEGWEACGRCSQSLKLDLLNKKPRKYKYTLNISEDLLKIILKDKLKQLGESFILGG